MRVRGCDRDCSSCALLELCGGIRQYGVKGYRCFEAGCELGFPAIRRMQECSACGIGKLTWDLKDEEVAELVDEIANLGKVKVQPIELPSVVPIVSLNDPSSYNFDPLKIEAIVVMFEDLFDENIRREVEKAGDIHSYLNFDGKVLVSSILPDDLITQEAVFYFFLGTVDELEFDGAIGWDSPVYVDIPLYDSWVNLLMGLKLTHELADWGIPVYGLAKGNVENQIRFSVETLAKIGITSMALHASEYMIVRKEDSTVLQILYTYFGYLSKLAESVLLVGVLNPRWLSFFEGSFPKGPRLSYAGMSWLLDAARGFLYTNTKYADATSQYVKCGCPTCSKAEPIELMANPSLRAKHNLGYLCNRLSDSSYEVPKLSTYDLILNEDDRLLLLSDLHMWTGRDLLDNLIDFLGEEKPTHIAFLGDIFDLKGRPDLPEARGFFYALEDLGSMIFVAKGCSDNDDEKFLSTYDKLAMGARPRSRLWCTYAFPVNMCSKGFMKLKSHVLNEGRIAFGYKSVFLLTYNNQDPVLLMYFINTIGEARGKIVGQPKWGTHVLEISADVVLARALVASGLSFGRKTRTDPSIDHGIVQDPKLFHYHIRATLTEEGWCSLKINKRRATFEIGWGRAVDITDSLSIEQINEIKELVEERRKRKIPIKSIIDSDLYKIIKSNPPKLFDNEITLLNFTHVQKERLFRGIPTKVHLSKEGRITSFWEIHFNSPDIIDFIHDTYGMLPGTWKARRFENLYEAYKKYRGRRLTDEEIQEVRKIKEMNPPKVTAEWISEKIRGLFPSVEWGADIEWIRKRLGRKESK